MYTSYTSESVCAGHPDKICDQISDAVLDEALRIDRHSRVAVETLVTKNQCVLAGEVTCPEPINFEKVTREVIRKLGYTNPHFGFTDQSPINIYIHEQSPEIAVGVDKQGAGDQGIMYGYATNETTNYMPISIDMAHDLARTIDKVREEKIVPYFRPDGKTQVTIQYENGKPKRIETIVIAVPHDEKVELPQVQQDILKHVIAPVVAKYKLPFDNNLIVNGTGVWHIGGPASDTGVTGRKIIVDTYGGVAHVGGGAFSGKDPTKVDRSAAYAARYVAKNIVAHKLADRCEVRLAYYIGAKQAIMHEVETYGTEKKSLKAIHDFMNTLLNTSVQNILDTLDLLRPIYFKTAAYGHFGRNEFPWEKII